MATPGYVFKDGQPIPDDELSNQPREVGQESHGKENTTQTTRQPAGVSSTASPVDKPAPNKLRYNTEAPTDSHALAFETSHEETGAAQEHHFETEVKDLGWNQHPDEVPKPLVGGLQNEDLWLLVRRFNRVSGQPVFARG
jgi:hypothetical protein